MQNDNYFLAWDQNSGISIKTYRPAGAYVGDIGDIAQALTEEQPGPVVCSIDDSTLGALESGEYWSGTNVSIHALEELHAIVTDHLDSIK